jgi:hypothetical protein
MFLFSQIVNDPDDLKGTSCMTIIRLAGSVSSALVAKTLADRRRKMTTTLEP